MRFSSFVLIALLAGFSLLYSCRKDERIEPKNTVSELKERFFNDHPSSDPLVQSLRQFFLSEDEDHNIVEKIVARIGFPHWDKSISISNSSNSDKVTNEPETLTYIPFVVDSQHFVNAALLIKTTPADTNYKFLCNWQYDQYGYDTSAAEWNARNVFHLFTQLDKSVFNITRFRIKDENLLTTEQKEYLTNMGLSFDSVEINYSSNLLTV